MSKGGQQQTSGQNSMDILYISAFFVLLSVGLWYTQHEAIVRFLYGVKVLELDFIIYCVKFFLATLQPFVVEHFGDVISLIDIDFSFFQIDALLELQRSMINVDYKQVTLSEMWGNMQAVGWFFAYLAWPVFVFMAIYLLFFSVGAKFNTSFSMESLRKKDSKLWPHITAVEKTDLINVDLDEEPWGMALRPLEFSKKYDLLLYTKKGGGTTIEVNKAAAKACFSLQMGALWSGVDSLPPYAQALFAIFCAKAEKDGKSASKLLKQISFSSKGGGKLDFSGARELLVKHVRKSKKVGRAIGAHAYIFTAMASMIEIARTDGVLATSEFLWLKTLDRQLWFMLSSIGRQTPFSEVSGPYAHWLVEKRLRRPLKVPIVDEAVEALIYAIADIKYNPDGY